MKINGNAIRPGNVIEHKGRLWVVLKTQHTQPGKGGAYLQAALKALQDGTKLNERFRSTETVERAHLEEREKQFLFSEGEDYTFMDNHTFDQIAIPQEMIGKASDFLQEGMMVTVKYYHETPVMVALPETVIMTVTEADAVVKGQTASSSYKPAVLENGRRVLVPPHIGAGTRIVVSTEDGSYVERAKD